MMAVFDTPSIWRNGITNTTAIIDYVRRSRWVSKNNKAFARFDADLNFLIEEWFKRTRTAAPQTYEEAEAVWQQFAEDFLGRPKS